ncbi:MAG: tetratricopeptide repeat protein [Desulfobacterales bacterium]|jgi:TolB-like protein/class 3 adenylate cyclase/Tfp pilus assembly protein PilF
MVDEGFKRKLAAILSADVEGYSRLMDDDEEATVRTLTAYRTAIADLVQQFRGRIVDTPGDNILAEFSSVVDCVNCAVELQRDIAERNADLPESRRMQFRIGVNLGDVIEEEGRIYGDGVNIAARVEAMAEAGGICISGRAYDHVENKLELEYENLGEHQVKNITRPIRVYRVLSFPGAAAHRVVQAKETLGRKWRKMALSIAATVVVAVIGLGIWHFYLRRPTVEPASVEKMAFPLPDKPSIAILPFDNMTGDPEQEFFSDGLVEEIITALSSVPEFFVVARNSTFTYKGKPVKVQQISEELGVQYVLEGSVRKSGEKVRITAQLIDALKGHHLWAETYDRNIEDLFAVQEEITVKVITELREKITGSAQIRFAEPCSENLEAYLKYLQANELTQRFNTTDNAKAKRLAEEAVALDPEYACAYSLLGMIHRMDVFLGSTSSPARSLATAREMVDKAMEINPSLAGPHGILSLIYLTMDQYEKAIAAAEKAVALEPNNRIANIAMGITLVQAGRPEESIPFIKKTMRIDPFSTSYLGYLGWAYFLAGQHEEAIKVISAHLDKTKDFRASLILAAAYNAAGREEEAHAVASEILEMNPKFTLEQFSKSLRYKNPEDKELIISNLRKAGLPDKPPLPLPDKPSIAVLAFDNLSGDPEQEFFSDGISEEILSALSKTDQLFVIARNSSFVYKGKPVDVKQVSRELGVRYLLEGSVRKSGDRVRITAQLIDATTGHHLWSERYDRELKDIFAVQDEITMEIITALQVELTEGEQMRMWASRYKRLDVQLKAMELLSLWREGSYESHMRHGQVAQEVVDMAPEQAVGYRGLGWYYWFLGNAGKSPKESYGKAFKFAQKALSIDESDPLTHGLLGNIYLIMRQYEKAIETGRRAIELEPNGAQVHGLLGLTLSFAGKPDEGIRYLDQAIRLNPFPANWYYQHLGRCYRVKGQYDKALIEFKKALQLSPKSAMNNMEIVAIYALLDRQEDAEAAAKKLLKVNPSFSVKRVSKALPYKNQADIQPFADALRKAGLPE